MFRELWQRFRPDTVSRRTARDRLQDILDQDRTPLYPELIDALKPELVEVFSRYFEVERGQLAVEVERHNGTATLIVNLPFRRCKATVAGGRERELPSPPQPHIDPSQFCCPNPQCPNAGKKGPHNHIIRSGFYGKGKRIPLLKCQVCGKRFSVRRNTVLFKLKVKEETFYQALAFLVKGKKIATTAQMVGCDPKTIRRWVKRALHHKDEVSHFLQQYLECEPEQLLRFWTQKER
ncbi:MAG: cell division topological specificity factor MinE [Nitrospinota bacterium]|nr:MAG: cell division topological specificity factor MinE [Nitrospinota bacterium]